MSTQLSLPASWARPVPIRHRDPREELLLLERARIETKAEVRIVLDSFAAQRGIAPREVNRAMDTVDDALADMVYEIRGELEREIEDGDPV